MSVMALTCIVWRAGLNTHGLRGRGGSGSAGCRGSSGGCCCCGQCQLLLLGLASLHDVPLFNLLIKLFIILLHILLQVWRQFVHAAEDLPRFLVKLLCNGELGKRNMKVS